VDYFYPVDTVGTYRENQTLCVLSKVGLQPFLPFYGTLQRGYIVAGQHTIEQGTFHYVRNKQVPCELKALSTIALFYLLCQCRTVAMAFDKASDRVDWKINQLVKPRSKPR